MGNDSIKPKYNLELFYLAWTGPEGSRRLRLPDLMTVGT
jgi:hypothetical protein